MPTSIETIAAPPAPPAPTLPPVLAPAGAAALVRMLTWLSPAFPIGAFSYSHGLEQAVADNAVHDRATLAQWVDAVLRYGSARVDATLFAAVHRAMASGDDARLAELAELAAAHQSSAELALESTAQGEAFLATVDAAWPYAALARLRAAWPGPYALPVAVAAAAAGHGLALLPVLTAYLHAFAANLVGAGVRLIPLGQTDGQRIMASLERVVVAAAEAGIARPLDRLGSATPMADWASAAHETLYARLFRS